MNRSAPVHAQDSPSAMKATQAETTASRLGLKASGVAAAILALVLLGYTALWCATALQLRGGVIDWIAARRAEGYRVAHGSVGIGGFPGLARVTVGAPSIAAPDGRALGWSWAGERAAIEASPLHRDVLTLRLFGEESVSINVNGKLRTYRGTADELTLRARGGSSPRSASLTVRNLSLAGEEPGDVVEVQGLSASGEALEHPPPAEPAAGYAVKIEGTAIQLPRQLDLPLGEAIADFSAGGIVRGPCSARSDFSGALARWRDAGGALELSQASLRYGPLVLEGSGTVSLDAAMQPVGTFVARIQEFQQTLSALTSRGLVDEETAAKVKIALAILSRPDAGGGSPTLSVPLSLHDRRLLVGPLPLMVVPLIEWPRGPSPRTGELPPLAGAATG